MVTTHRYPVRALRWGQMHTRLVVGPVSTLKQIGDVGFEGFIADTKDSGPSLPQLPIGPQAAWHHIVFRPFSH